MTAITTDETLKLWQEEEAALRDRLLVNGITAPGVARPEQMAGLTGLEQIQQLVDGKIPPPPIAATLDFALVRIEFGRVIFQGKPSAKFLNPMGGLHGGWYATLLDSALGCSVHTSMPVGRGYTTLFHF